MIDTTAGDANSCYSSVLAGAMHGMIDNNRRKWKGTSSVEIRGDISINDDNNQKRR